MVNGNVPLPAYLTAIDPGDLYDVQMGNEENEFLQSWAAENLDEDAFKKQVSEIVRSYRHGWDIFAELAQNSVDAINLRSLDPALTDFIGEIRIEIDPNESTIKFRDNGIGIDDSSLVAALTPGKSFKRMGQTLGYKGYGLTFILFASTYCRISSVHNGKISELVVKDAFNWLTTSGSSNLYDLPSPEWIRRQVDSTEESGTTITLKLPTGSYQQSFPALASFDSLFEWSQQLKPLEYILRLKTAIGFTGGIFGKEPPVTVNVRARVLNGEEKTIPFKYLLPNDELEYFRQSSYNNPADYLNIFEDGNISDSEKFFRSLTSSKLGLQVGSQKIVLFDACTVICGRTGLTKLAEEFAVKNFSSIGIPVTTGIHLSLGGMPTGITLTNWESRGHDWQKFFVLVDATLDISDQLDPGRKGISEYFADLIVEKTVSLISDRSFGSTNPKKSLKDFAQKMNEPPQGQGGQIRQLAERVGAARANLASSITDISRFIEYQPQDENEVIALFADLVGQGLIPGYRSVVLSQSTVYDSAMTFSMPIDDDRFGRSIGNPLGLGLSRAQQAVDTIYQWKNPQNVDWFIVEFKLRALDFVKNRDQTSSEADLLICWDYDEVSISNHGATIVPAQPTYDAGLWGVTHRLTHEGSTVDVIVMMDLLDMIRQSAP